MQRTVKGATVTAVKVTIENGNFKNEVIKKDFISMDEETAKKKCGKNHPELAIVDTEQFEDLYYLPDEIFFKYAVKVKHNGEVVNEIPAEETETEENGEA